VGDFVVFAVGEVLWCLDPATVVVRVFTHGLVLVCCGGKARF
jgi:hypothetical protein